MPPTTQLRLAPTDADHVSSYKLSGETPDIKSKGELDLAIVNLLVIEMQNTKHKVSIIIGTVNKFSCCFMDCMKDFHNFQPNAIRHTIVNEVAMWSWKHQHRVNWRNEEEWQQEPAYWKGRVTRGYWDPETRWVGLGKLFENNRCHIFANYTPRCNLKDPRNINNTS